MIISIYFADPFIEEKIKSDMSKEEKLKRYHEEIDKIINSGNYRACMTDNYNSERLALLPQEKQDWFHQKYGKQLV